MSFFTSHRIFCGAVIFGYLLIGMVITIAGGGFFSGPISARNSVLSAPYQEFLQAKGEVSNIGAICKVNNLTGFSGDKVVVLAGSIVEDERGKPKDIWVSPFATPDDAVCFHLESEESATIEYFTRKPAAPSRPAELIFIDECWPKLRLKDELMSLNESGKYGFYICPAEPMEHNITLKIHGFGSYSGYDAKVINPKNIPYISRSRGKIMANSLNYLWAFPLDCVIMPIALPAFQIWWHNFVKF